MLYKTTVTCLCGYTVTFHLFNPMDDHHGYVGDCPLCNSKKMSLVCERNSEEKAAWKKEYH